MAQEVLPTRAGVQRQEFLAIVSKLAEVTPHPEGKGVIAGVREGVRQVAGNPFPVQSLPHDVRLDLHGEIED